MSERIGNLHAKPCPDCKDRKDSYKFCDTCFGSGIVSAPDDRPSILPVAVAVGLILAGVLCYAAWLFR